MQAVLASVITSLREQVGITGSYLPAAQPHRLANIMIAHYHQPCGAITLALVCVLGGPEDDDVAMQSERRQGTANGQQFEGMNHENSYICDRFLYSQKDKDTLESSGACIVCVSVSRSPVPHMVGASLGY